MKNSIWTRLHDLIRLGVLRPKHTRFDTLTAFVRDAEHDIVLAAMALQAHVDLLHDEQDNNQSPVIRFSVLNRSIHRIITDISVLGVVSELVQSPRSQEKQVVESMMQEIAKETRSAFRKSEVSLSCNIDQGTTLVGNADALKLMIKGMVLALLHKSQRFETLTVGGHTDEKGVSLSFDCGSQPATGTFTPWQLGELRLHPANGDGIGLAAVEAMAQFHHGNLNVSTFSDQRHGYKLIFAV